MYSDLLSVFIALALGGLTAYLAKGRGRSPPLWFCLGILFGVFGLLALFLLRPQEVAEEEARPQVIDVTPSEPETAQEKSVTGVRWFYLDAKHQQQGSVSFEELKSLWQVGNVTSSTYVWCEGMADWKVVGDLKELLTLLSLRKGVL